MAEGDVPEEADDDAIAVDVVLYLALTADATEVQKGISYTPVTVKILNLGASMRSLMSNIRMLAVFPPHIKDHNGLLRPIVEDLYKHRPGGGNPIRIRHPKTNQLMHLFLHMAYTVNDLRGVPACTGGKQAPSIEGSCWKCKIRGLHRQSRTIYPAAVRMLPKNHELRRKFATEFGEDETLRQRPWHLEKSSGTWRSTSSAAFRS